MSSHPTELASSAAEHSSLAARRPRLRSIGAALGATVLLAGAATSALHAQGAQDRQRAMYVTVTDSNGAPVAGLTRADLVVREDGVQREILRVEPATSPIEITLVVDTGDAASPYIADMRRALTDFIADMAKGNHIAITTIGGRPQLVQNYTANVELLNRAVGRLFAEQGTGAYLLEALSSIAKGVAKRGSERATIIAILVQAGPEFSNDAYESVIRALRDCGATFDAVTFTAQAEAVAARAERTSANRDREIVLDQASRGTGGLNEEALSSMALAPKLKSLAAQLHSQYRVVYARPDSLIPPEKIEVSTKKPGFNARGTPVRVPR